ncbi:MAG: DUF4435 domain-containing protein [Ignavibacteriae bacterium]|nr:DUF4435 domain-containing protein [Ignavibacteriota bacterium]
MLKYNSTVQKLSSVFFKYRNDITIFTEDKITDKEFYVSLLNRLVDKKVKISDIIPLGCKSNLVNACTRNINQKGTIYIVDGDLDLITDNNPKNIKNLFVLNAYCIENFLIDEIASVELLFYCNIGNREQIKKNLNFKKWLGYNRILIELFLNLALAKSLGLGPKLKTAHDFLTVNDKQTILDKAKVKIEITSLKTSITDKYLADGIKNPNEYYKTQLDVLKKKWGDNDQTYLTVVSGKNYILPLLQFRLNHSMKKSKSLFPKDSFKLFLANHCELDRLSSLKKFLIKNS